MTDIPLSQHVHKQSEIQSKVCMFLVVVFVVQLMSRSTLCDPMDCSPPDSSVCKISQARILEWVTISYFRQFSQTRDQTRISCASCMGRWILYHYHHLGNLQCCLGFTYLQEASTSQNLWNLTYLREFNLPLIKKEEQQRLDDGAKFSYKQVVYSHTTPYLPCYHHRTICLLQINVSNGSGCCDLAELLTSGHNASK